MRAVVVTTIGILSEKIALPSVPLALYQPTLIPPPPLLDPTLPVVQVPPPVPLPTPTVKEAYGDGRIKAGAGLGYEGFVCFVPRIEQLASSYFVADTST
jgi:hypothetical protein